MNGVPPRLVVNGRPVDADGFPPGERLLDTLRWRLGLKGTKEGCRTGDCGACTVLIDGVSALSCLVWTHEVLESEVTTIEGLGDDPVTEAVRAAFEAEGAVQCGYCTPGFLVALTSLLRARPSGDVPTDLREELAGNLCRCTGYAAILRAVARAERELR